MLIAGVGAADLHKVYVSYRFFHITPLDILRHLPRHLFACAAGAPFLGHEKGGKE
jgi:hypothetical protein